MDQVSNKRDEKGDVKFNTGRFDWKSYNQARHTYVFQYLHPERQIYIPYFDLFSKSVKRMEAGKAHSDYCEVSLYKSPERPPYDFSIQYNNWQLGLLVKFFKEVFEERAFIEGYQPSNKFFRIILPRQERDRISNFINDFELLTIKDLIYEIIAIAQEKYVEDIAFWERPENQKIIKTAEKETKKAIEVLERIDDKKWLRGEAKRPPELVHINFVFQDGTIKIEHPWLAKEFIEHFKEHYDDLPFRNWRKNLERYPNRFESNLKGLEFKYRLAKSLYNMLTQSKQFKVSDGEPYPNKLMLCIARVLEFCLIPVGSFDETDGVKIKHVRNWLKRKDLEESIIATPIIPDKERLLKYFEPNFVNLTGDIKKLDAISTAVYLTKRFDLERLLPDLVHIAQVLREGYWLIGHQMFGGNQPTPPFKEFNAFQELVLAIKERKRTISKVRFTLEGDTTEHELSQRLPLYLIEEALRDYIQDNQSEFDTDAVKTSIERTPEGFKVEKGNQFSLPEERFLIRFVDSFYNYLLHEAPPSELDYLPSKDYYTIIANMLQMSWCFYNKMDPEWFIVAKVKQWHELVLNSKKE